MKTANLEPDGNHAGAVARGRKGQGRAGGDVRFIDPAGNDVVAASWRITGAAAKEDDDEGVLMIGGAISNVKWAQADGDLVGDGTTDNTDALQTLIETCTADGTQSCTIRFEPGHYLISGALQDTGAFNGQILLPNVANPNPLITLTFEGPARPQWQGPGTGALSFAEAGYAILQSDLTGGTGTAAVISAGNGITNYLQVNVHDLWCIAPDDPSLTFWNLSSTRDGIRDGLLIGTDGVWPGPAVITEPTNTSAVGYRGPVVNNNSIAEDNVFVIGYYTGVELSELFYADLNVWYCKVGVELAGGYHLNDLRIQALNCNVGVLVTGETYARILYDGEHATTPANGAWATRTYDLNDGSNLLNATWDWTSVLGSVGNDHSLVYNGGANVRFHELGGATTGSSTTGGVLLLASDAGDPIVFDDILQASDASDFLYSSE